MQVKFNKDKSVRGEAASTTAPPVAPSTTSTAASPGDTTAAPASSADDVSSLSGRTPPTDTTGSAAAAEPSAAAASSASSPADAASTPAASTEPGPSRPASPFEAVDLEFREFAKAMWGEDVLKRLPTQEELAEQAAMAREAWAKREAEFEERARAAQEARAKREAEFEEMARAAKEARAKRVLAMRRATMAADISLSEDGSSYVVRYVVVCLLVACCSRARCPFGFMCTLQDDSGMTLKYPLLVDDVWFMSATTAVEHINVLGGFNIFLRSSVSAAFKGNLICRHNKTRSL